MLPPKTFHFSRNHKLSSHESEQKIEKKKTSLTKEKDKNSNNDADSRWVQTKSKYSTRSIAPASCQQNKKYETNEAKERMKSKSPLETREQSPQTPANDDLMNLISRKTYMGMKLNDQNIHEWNGLFFKRGELIVSAKCQQNKKLIKRIRNSTTEYYQILNAHKNKQQRQIQTLQYGRPPVSEAEFNFNGNSDIHIVNPFNIDQSEHMDSVGTLSNLNSAKFLVPKYSNIVSHHEIENLINNSYDRQFLIKFVMMSNFNNKNSKLKPQKLSDNQDLREYQLVFISYINENLDLMIDQQYSTDNDDERSIKTLTHSISSIDKDTFKLQSNLRIANNYNTNNKIKVIGENQSSKSNRAADEQSQLKTGSIVIEKNLNKKKMLQEKLDEMKNIIEERFECSSINHSYTFRRQFNSAFISKKGFKPTIRGKSNAVNTLKIRTDANHEKQYDEREKDCADSPHWKGKGSLSPSKNGSHKAMLGFMSSNIQSERKTGNNWYSSRKHFEEIGSIGTTGLSRIDVIETPNKYIPSNKNEKESLIGTRGFKGYLQAKLGPELPQSFNRRGSKLNNTTFNKTQNQFIQNKGKIGQNLMLNIMTDSSHSNNSTLSEKSDIDIKPFAHALPITKIAATPKIKVLNRPRPSLPLQSDITSSILPSITNDQASLNMKKKVQYEHSIYKRNTYKISTRTPSKYHMMGSFDIEMANMRQNSQTTKRGAFQKSGSTQMQVTPAFRGLQAQREFIQNTTKEIKKQQLLDNTKIQQKEVLRSKMRNPVRVAGIINKEREQAYKLVSTLVEEARNSTKDKKNSRPFDKQISRMVYKRL